MNKYNAITMRPMSPARGVAILVTSFMVCIALLLPACSDQTSEKKAKDTDQTPVKIQSDTNSPEKQQDENSFDIKYTPPNVPYDLNGTPVEIAGAVFVPATQWEELGSSGEMIAHYLYGPLEKETEQAEVTVFFFGEKPHDSQEIMERWMDQISIADGRDARSTARLHSRQVGGMTAHVLSMDGIYTPPSDGFDKEDTGVRDYFRLIGVVIEAPGGNIFFKLTGPDYTGRVMIDQFMNMIYRVKKT